MSIWKLDNSVLVYFANFINFMLIMIDVQLCKYYILLDFIFIN